jgi:Domain of unknown function (DUF4194)
MSQHEFDTAALPAGGVVHAIPPPSASLYFGDKGELPADARRVFAHLLQGPSVDEHRQPNLWRVLLSHEEVLRQRLADLFLELIIDTESKFAYIRQADTGDVESVQLLREKQLPLIDSLVLLFLRQRLSKAASSGLRAIVAADEIRNYMAVYEKSGSKDHAGFGRRVDAAINRIRSYSILHRAGSNYEISPALKLMIGAEEVQSLTEIYEKLAQEDIFDEPEQESKEGE